MFKFEKLNVWQKTIDLAIEMEDVVEGLPTKERYCLSDQLRRAILSISTNIAEGSGREGEKESKHFYNIAKGSVYESVSLLRVAMAKGYIGHEVYAEFYKQLEEIAKMLTGLLRK